MRSLATSAPLNWLPVVERLGALANQIEFFLFIQLVVTVTRASVGATMQADSKRATIGRLRRNNAGYYVNTFNDCCFYRSKLDRWNDSFTCLGGNPRH